ncbi:hypothetical protein IP69_06315 [Bosea sp. AAP35]|nr:hypothetical protein IP69_06315 [Bosea sp. AAP35]
MQGEKEINLTSDGSVARHIVQASKLLDCSFFAETLQQMGQMKDRVRIIRRQANGPVIGFDCLLMRALLFQRVRILNPNPRLTFAQGDRLCVKSSSFTPLPLIASAVRSSDERIKLRLTESTNKRIFEKLHSFRPRICLS